MTRSPSQGEVQQFLYLGDFGLQVLRELAPGNIIGRLPYIHCEKLVEVLFHFHPARRGAWKILENPFPKEYAIEDTKVNEVAISLILLLVLFPRV